MNEWGSVEPARKCKEITMTEFMFDQFREAFAVAANECKQNDDIVKAIRSAEPAWSLATSGMDSLDIVDTIMKAEDVLKPLVGEDASLLPNEITDEARSIGHLYELWCGRNNINPVFPPQSAAS